MLSASCAALGCIVLSSIAAIHNPGSPGVAMRLEAKYTDKSHTAHSKGHNVALNLKSGHFVSNGVLTPAKDLEMMGLSHGTADEHKKGCEEGHLVTNMGRTMMQDGTAAGTAVSRERSVLLGLPCSQGSTFIVLNRRPRKLWGPASWM
ncbi:hypothetical protein TRVL_04804 [Trypanosoma vivax]|uniref:Uncharacterized protein n=1 Tax=Trypanosoma vivax (strain Y486) TaxID=1055687 RepID=G0U3X6_TRYVY|nr:hypothetical protein TRVL_04804 [Trypanosoma vivax]CCC52136.1 hypothetical protein TVY486_1011790 [Trypanosoma vivax Y486]